MTLRDFSDEEKRAFISLAGEMMTADGHLHPREFEMIRRMMAFMGLPQRLPPTIDRARAYAAFATTASRELALYELLGLAYVEGEYARSEARLAGDLADAIGIDPARKAAIEADVRAFMVGTDGPRLGHFYESYAPTSTEH